MWSVVGYVGVGEGVKIGFMCIYEECNYMYIYFVRRFLFFVVDLGIFCIFERGVWLELG